MSWLLITLSGYFLLGLAAIVDKTMVTRAKLTPFAYTFSIALLGGILVLFLMPFVFGVPSLLVSIIALVSGACFIWALILTFKALEKDDASRVSPMVGGLTIFFVFILAWFVLQENLKTNQYIAFIFLIFGIFLMSLDFKDKGAFSWLKKKLLKENKIDLPKIRKTVWLALPSSILFAIYNITQKFVFSNTEFWTGFIWVGLGSFLTVFLIFLIPNKRMEIKESFKLQRKQPEQGRGTLIRLLFGQACGGLGSILIRYAIAIGSVTLVNALQGVQYAFVFVLVILLSFFWPKLLKEKLTKEIVIQKILAIVFIFIGLYLISA